MIHLCIVRKLARDSLRQRSSGLRRHPVCLSYAICLNFSRTDVLSFLHLHAQQLSSENANESKSEKAAFEKDDDNEEQWLSAEDSDSGDDTEGKDSEEHAVCFSLS